MDSTEFRIACSHFPTGVSIVTREVDGIRLGVTISSFTSVSLEPTLVLVCVHNRSTFLNGLGAGDALVINVLGKDQSDVADRFARLPPPERFETDQWDHLELREASAAFSCRVEEIHAAGDHTIVICEVERAKCSFQNPLVYCRSKYHVVGDEARL